MVSEMSNGVNEEGELKKNDHDMKLSALVPQNGYKQVFFAVEAMRRV